jgi:DNA uptake protein ComE-like DNA-binding protein
MKLLCPAARRGSVLILVLWISFGLVALSLYFANSMSFEIRAADNRAAALGAEQAIEGAARYVSYVLATHATNGAVPRASEYGAQAMPVGEASFWLLGRGDDADTLAYPVFALVDEASKLNLNASNVTAEILQGLPGMTAELAGAIIDWRDADSNPGTNGAEDEIYGRLQPPRRCKNGRFESVEELRLVHGATLDVLFGEDVNRNGLLDPNENDGDLSPPADNRDGRLDAGILDYVTVYSRQPNTRSGGATNRINVANLSSQQTRTQLQALLNERFGNDRANQILQRAGNGPFNSVLQFYVRSRMTPDEFAQIQTDITTSSGAFIEGLVNVNTASEAVLACIPGIGANFAPSLVAYRQANPDQLNSLAWVAEVLDENAINQAGRHLTGEAWQFTADVAALGPHARGFRRVRFVFDTSEGAPKILYRQDQTALGWALGLQLRQDIQLAKEFAR